MKKNIDFNFIHGRTYMIKCTALQSNSNNPRKYFCLESLEKLSESILYCGQIHPITFTLIDGLLVIVSGERRWRSILSAGTEYIQAKYVAEKAEEIAFAENSQREDLTPLERAELLFLLKTKHNFTLTQLSEYTNKSVSSVSELLSLRHLAEDIKEACRNSNKYGLTRLVQIAKAPGQKSQRKLFKAYQRELAGEKFRGELRRDQSAITKLFTRLDRVYADILKVETEHWTKKDLCILYSKFNGIEQVMDKKASEYSH